MTETAVATASSDAIEEGGISSHSEYSSRQKAPNTISNLNGVTSTDAPPSDFPPKPSLLESGEIDLMESPYTNDPATDPSPSAATGKTLNLATNLPFISSSDHINYWLEKTLTSQSKSKEDHSEQDHGRKRQRSSSSSPSADQGHDNLPLTRKRLKQHLADMSTNPSSISAPYTPRKGGSNYSQTTPGQSCSPSFGADYSVRGHMADHGIFMDRHILDIIPGLQAFKILVSQIVCQERPSAVKPESAAKFANRLRWINGDNEATILLKILPFLIKDGRRIPAPQEQQEESGNSKYVDEDFELGGLQFSADREFTRGFLPNMYADAGFEAKVANEMAKVHGMRNPKPDRVYGLMRTQLSRLEGAMLRPETKTLISHVPNMVAAFFIIEGKASNGSMARAMVQACRGGTSRVHVVRILLGSTGQLEDEKDGPCTKSYVYSATLDDACMYIWVHFALVTGVAAGQKKVEYCMEMIMCCMFRHENALTQLRGACHNILDWGIRGRMTDVRNQYETIVAYETNWMQQAAIQSQRDAEQREADRKNKQKSYNKQWYDNRKRRASAMSGSPSESGSGNGN